MSMSRLAVLVASFCLVIQGSPADARRAHAQTNAGMPFEGESIASATVPTETTSGSLDDSWHDSDLFEPPIDDPWSAPQQQERGPRGGQADALVYKARVAPHWFHGNSRFWYRNDLAGGTREFILVDAETGSRTRAFDQEKLASALSKAVGGTVYTADKLPFDAIEFDAEAKSIRFQVEKDYWTCTLDSYECTKSRNTAAISQDTAEAPEGRARPA